MKECHHYIIVRRDLPLGVALAMVAHVAFANGFQHASSSVLEHRVSSPGVGGSTPSSRSSFEIPRPSQEGVGSNAEDALKAARGPIPEPIVVVLGARNEYRLQRLTLRLAEAAVAYAEFTETDAPYAGQLMAVGVQLGQKDDLLPLVEEFHLTSG